MAENQNPSVQPAQAMPAAKKMKHNPVVPAVIVFVSIAAFLAVWYMAVK